MFKNPYANQHYFNCISKAVAKRMASFRGHQIDRIQEIPQATHGDRIFLVSLTIWDKAENRTSLTYELQVGSIEGVLEVVYWIAL